MLGVTTSTRLLTTGVLMFGATGEGQQN